MGSISVDIDISEIVFGMTKRDRRELFTEMKNDGYISEHCIVTNDGEVKSEYEQKILSDSTDEFNCALKKLFGNGWKLTKEEEEYIINISNRFG